MVNMCVTLSVLSLFGFVVASFAAFALRRMATGASLRPANSTLLRVPASRTGAAGRCSREDGAKGAVPG